MPSAIDVAQYILESKGAMNAMKLEKLTYYAQAWHLAWRGRRLFEDRIEAWARGPMIPVLFARHRGQFTVSDVGGDAAKVRQDANVKAVVDRVVDHYFVKSGQQLSDLTHVEDPWLSARAGVSDGMRSEAEITPEAICAYYHGLIRDHS